MIIIRRILLHTAFGRAAQQYFGRAKDSQHFLQWAVHMFSNQKYAKESIVLRMIDNKPSHPPLEIFHPT
jgi:uncharacterized protein (UPF0128 family)